MIPTLLNNQSPKILNDLVKLESHHRYLNLAIDLAIESAEKGNHPFGAVLVCDDQVIGQSQNTVNSDRDVTRHAELNLISWASRSLAADLLKRSTLYASTEPCAMCSGAIVWAGVRHVVYASSAKGLVEILGESFFTECRHIFSRCEHFLVEGPLEENKGNGVHQRCWENIS